MTDETECKITMETENLSELKVTEPDVIQKDSGDNESKVEASIGANDVEKVDSEIKPIHDKDNGIINGEQKDSILSNANDISAANETEEVSEVNLNKCDSDSEEKNESETAPVKIKEFERKKEEEENNAASSNPPVDEDSDGEIVDSDEDNVEKVDYSGLEDVARPQVDYIGIEDVVRPELDQLDYDEDVDEGEIKDEVPEKKESKDQAEKEMSEGEIASSDGEVESDSEKKNKKGSARFKSDDYEEGEMVDPSDGPVQPKETCRFFERGSCTWGDRCRFIHPGVNDKGRYKMFDSERRRPPFMGPMPMRFPPPFDPRGHPIPPHFPPPMMLGPPPPETAWERGLRHAKEMRRRSMQRKVEEPDFMRKREVLSLNEALNVDRDLDYIAQKPLADDERGGDPFAVLEEDERFAVPSIEDVKKMKRSGKSSRNDGRSNDGMKRQLSPRSHIRREIDDRGRDRRSPPRHPGMDNRHQAPPMPHHMSHMHHDYRDRRDPGGERSSRHEKDYRDRSMKERDYRMDPSRNYPMDNWRDMSPRRREMESRVVAVDSTGKKKKAHSGRGETWSDPWARGRQSLKKRASRSDSESSGSSSSSSSRSSFSSRSGSDSSRSSSRSSYSSSDSSSGSSRSPSPKKTTKKVVKTKKNVAAKATAASKAKNSPKPSKPLSSVAVKPASTVKKAADIVKAKLTKPPANKSSPKIPTAPITKPPVKDKAAARGRPPVKTVPKKGKPKTYDSSSSSEFSHSSSSESRSRSRSAGKDSDSFSESGSSSGSSSGSDSYTSSSGSSSGSSDEEEATKKTKPAKKVAVVKPLAPPPGEKKAAGKMSLPTKAGNAGAKMNVSDKASKAPGSTESRKRSAAAMTNAPTKKGAAIANRRSELLEQLKVVENAILKKKAKLT